MMSFGKSVRCSPRLRQIAGLAGLIAMLVAFAAAGDKPAHHKKLPPEYALLMGTVWSAESRPLPGVAVKIRRSEDKKARWTVVSDGRGEFAQRVPVGKADYVIWTEPKGRKPVETTAHVENDERVDVGLHLTE
jgi:hypothetical protein